MSQSKELIEHVASQFYEKYVPEYFLTITFGPQDKIDDVYEWNHKFDLHLFGLLAGIKMEIDRAIGNRQGKYTNDFPYILIPEKKTSNGHDAPYHVHGLFFQTPHSIKVWNRRNIIHQRVMKYLRKRGFDHAVLELEEVYMKKESIHYVLKDFDRNVEKSIFSGCEWQ
tara:strand:+ start:624 stop:1127 length:504 start_codon:yes stop_codon:yes gene_type:complete